MAVIHFYGKRDCINNRRQKELLRAAGHEIIEYDLLRMVVTPEALRPFFENRPLVEWFNPTAPSIRSGKIRPEQLDENSALQQMLFDRLLIRRPLIRIGSEQFCGFDTDRLRRLIDFTPAAENRLLFEQLINKDLVTCPQTGGIDCTVTEEVYNG